MAAREHLDNLIYVVICNLQRLDGPVRGNGKIIQELEGAFRGAGWNVIKVVWGSDWDPLLADDKSGLLIERMNEVVDGQYQKYSVESGDYIRDHFFGTSPQLRALVDHVSDEQLQRLNRGGHDPNKVYAAYKAAIEYGGGPTVILAKTIKGYGLGEAGEGRNITHKQHELNEEELRAFRTRFNIPLTDEGVHDTPFYKPQETSEEIRYLHARRDELGGFLPARNVGSPKLDVPPLESLKTLLEGSDDREVTTTMAFGRILSTLLKNEQLGKCVVPIIPDEARTFGLESLFGQYGIYASSGQLYDPVDAGQLMYYREARDGQILEEGITEAGAMSSFIAAGTSYAHLQTPMIPFYLYYSMFGFQRVGDLIWAAADARAKGFLLGATAGRTTLQGEGLQHEDGHSQLVATTVPSLESYDPAYVYELAVIVHDGLRRMYVDNESTFYYVTLYNGPYRMRPMPEGAADGILKGMYQLSSLTPDELSSVARPQLFGSGPLLPEALRAQQILAEQFGIGSDVWSVTSYCRLRREALAVDRYNSLHPTQPPRRSSLQKVFDGLAGPFIAVTDYVKLVPDQLRQWVPGRYVTLGTDEFGRRDTRKALRRHFEVDAEHIAFATLSALSPASDFDSGHLLSALKLLDIDPASMAPATA